MPATAASASREIIVGLHDVMAKRASAQAKLNHVVDLIAEKRRHDAIVEAGWRVVRVTSEDQPTRSGLHRRLVPLFPPDVTRALRPRVDLAR